jgi:predicted AlkP superfamily pyrophosphatase or phosphodiesterase
MMAFNFIKPNYGVGGFAGLPKRITDWMTGPDKYDAVVLFLIDGFGWRFFEKFQDEAFLKTIANRGTVEKLTSQFPSTTAAHITTLHTGQPVGEHGVFEWIYCEPTLDTVVAPLLFSHAGTRDRDTLKQTGIKPRHILPTATLYQSFKKLGISSFVLQHREYTPASYGDVLFSGAKALGYKTLPEALINLAELLEIASSPSYYVLYNDKVDAICHEYGPDSAQTNAEILVLLMTMENIFLNAVSRNRKKILFLLTADHGQSEVDPQTTVYINREAHFTGIDKFIKTNRQGELIVPGGSPRDFFLYIRDGLVDEACSFLTQRLQEKAEVRKVAQLMSDGYFGPVLSPKFKARVGDLVILPNRYESVWWYEKNKHDQHYYGHHGGLTPQEMEIPLLRWEL